MYRGTGPLNRIGMLGKRIIIPGLVPSVGNLDGTITVGATSVNATARYNALDATVSAWPAWTYGQSLSIYASGADPTLLQESPLSGALDKSLLINSKYYRYASGSSYADITTEDIYLEGILYAGNSSTLYYLYKVSTPGYYLAWIHTSNLIRLFINSGTGTVSFNSSTLTPHTWYFIQIAINRDENSTNGAVIYANAVSATANPYSARGTATTTDNLRVGLSAGCRIAYLGLWLRTDLWSAGATGKAEMDALAASRSSLVKWW